MIKNYLFTAVRNLLRHKFYSAINIFGLAIGIACTLFIFLYIQDELAYDRFHPHAERIYRVVEKIDAEGQGEESSSNPFPTGRALREEYPQLVESSVRFFNLQAPQLSLKYGEQKLNEKKLFFADSTLWKVFNFPLLKGNTEKALSEPNTIVLTEAMAEKYFGKEDPMGKVLRFEGVLDLKVSGILKKVPSQSHLDFDGLISFSTVPKLIGPNYEKNWIWNPCWTYVLLKPGVSPKELEAQFPAFVNKHHPDFVKAQTTYYLQPLTDIHLTSNLDYEMGPNSDKNNLYIFGVIGLFVLLIACINFMNLATARAAGRAKEVGVRKAAGAHRGQLIGQFLLESMLLSSLAVILALLLIELLLPLFNEVAGKNLELHLFQNPKMLVSLLLTGLLAGLISGTYPAFFLSAFNPVKVLKGDTGTGGASGRLRKGLVIAQFAISLALIISTAVIYGQLQYLRSANLGFKKEQVLILPTRPPIASKFDALRNELLSDKSVLSVTTMNEVIGEKHNTHEYNYTGMQPGKWIYFPALLVNEDFVQTFDIELVAGRNFSRDRAREDSLSLLINESMVKHLGWKSPEAAIGQQFYTPQGKERVIGVMKDFNFVSLTKPIGPFVIDLPHPRGRGFWIKYIALRIAPGNVPATLAHVEKQWNKFAAEYPFEYFFLDDQLSNQYQAQEKLGTLVGYFSVLAILIACLGLFALASFTAQQRTKEIGIRKVMGASVNQLVYLLTKDFARLVLISSVIAFPLAWYAMHRWLKSFAYHTSMPWWVFGVAVVLGLVIAMLTVSFQAMKAAYANPVRSLKNE